MTKKKNGETETKRVLDNLRMPKVQEIFTSFCRVSTLREAPCFANVFAIILP